jgi:DNA (cytosine-5)-methyltransferase 1
VVNLYLKMSLNTEILGIYDGYYKQITNISAYNQRYKEHCKYNNNYNGKTARNPNFPEIVSETLVCLKIKNSIFGHSGDCKVKSYKIEVKCISSNGPISFGPTEYWDILVIVDARKQPIVDFYLYYTSSNSFSWQNLKISSNHTFGDFCKQGKRPRITFTQLNNQKNITFLHIGRHNIYNMLKEPHTISKYKLTMRIKIGDFFAGIGGIRLGFEKASSKFECVFTNEIDKYAIQTYETNFKNHNVDRTSISELKSDTIPDFDIFLGGFPCQPFSIAGNQKGFDDHRGNLFFDIARILRDKKPKAFLLENVKNLATHDEGNTMRVISKTLLEIGYTFRYAVLNTCKYANVPQNRERVFMVGFLDENITDKFRFPKQTELTMSVADCIEDASDKYYYTEESKIYPILTEHVQSHINTNQVYQFRRHYVRANQSNVCPTLTANMGGGGHNVPIIKDDKGIRKLTPRECFNLQGFPRDYIIPSISDAQLYKQIGNSVSVPLIKLIAKNILLSLKKKEYEGDPGIIVRNHALSFQGMSCDELRKKAREQNISGRSKMNKAQLIEALQIEI